MIFYLSQRQCIYCKHRYATYYDWEKIGNRMKNLVILMQKVFNRILTKAIKRKLKNNETLCTLQLHWAAKLSIVSILENHGTFSDYHRWRRWNLQVTCLLPLCTKIILDRSFQSWQEGGGNCHLLQSSTGRRRWELLLPHCGKFPSDVFFTHSTAQHGIWPRGVVSRLRRDLVHCTSERHPCLKQHMCLARGGRRFTC